MRSAKKINKNSRLGFFANSYRIIDANLNRAKEGLRVCEEISRFHLNNLNLTESLNKMRHTLTRLIKKAKLDHDQLFEYRDIKSDIGKAFTFGPKRRSFENIFLANSQRTKEALRVLEEFLKIFDMSASKKIQRLRFDFYAFEKKAVKSCRSLSDPR